jgi:hypothetical protein
MSCNHSIEITSVKNNETVPNSIILLKGTINPCHESRSQLTIIINNRENSDEKCDNFECGKFKILVKLRRNNNLIELKYCNCTIAINVVYQEEQRDFKVVPLWIINSGHDGRFQAEHGDIQNSPEVACQKINLSLKLVQCMFAQKLLEAGYPRKSFIVEDTEVFQSDLSVDFIRNLDEFEIYDEIAQEILEKKGDDCIKHTKFVGFLSCTHFEGVRDGDLSYKNIRSKVQANPSLGGNFLCLLGSGCLFSWPSHLKEVIDAFRNDKLVDTTQLFDDSNYRRTYGGCFSTTLGSLSHELSHTFDLGHTQNGIMGKHFDYIGRFFLTKFLTENLPERLLTKCQKSSTNLPKNPNLQKLTKIRNTGQQFIQKYHQQKDNDMTFFEQNCYITLNYHKWFNSMTSESNLQFERSDRTVYSFSSFLKLVEIRDTENSLLIKYWNLMDSNVGKFKIPFDVGLANVTLFAIDDCGGILKVKL